MLRSETIQAALCMLEAAGVVVVGPDRDGTVRWATLTSTEIQRFEHLDLRHTFATWLEDAGIPGRVIDELMGHDNTHRARQDR